MTDQIFISGHLAVPHATVQRRPDGGFIVSYSGKRSVDSSIFMREALLSGLCILVGVCLFAIGSDGLIVFVLISILMLIGYFAFISDAEENLIFSSSNVSGSFGKVNMEDFGSFAAGLSDDARRAVQLHAMREKNKLMQVAYTRRGELVAFGPLVREDWVHEICAGLNENIYRIRKDRLQDNFVIRSSSNGSQDF